MSNPQKHFNELRNEMKEENTSLVKQFDKRFDANDEKFDKRLNDISESQKQMIKHCDNIIEKMKEQTEEWKRDPGKLNDLTRTKMTR